MPVNPLTIFTLVFGLVEIVGTLLVFLILTWLSLYRGGFSWRSNPKQQFNWHPLLMTVGFTFVFGNAALVYRTYRNNRKKKLKIVHATVNISAVFFIGIGLQAAFDSHNYADPPIPNLYSLHSWFGIATVGLFSSQWIIGFVTFLYPGLTPRMRRFYLPFHIYFGLFTFIFSTTTCLLGLTEKTLFSVKNYSELPSEGILINVIGCTFIVFGSLVSYLLLDTKYKREPIPEDNVLLTANEPNANQEEPTKPKTPAGV